MITLITILVASLVCLVSILANKQRELKTGKSLLKVGSSNADYALRLFWQGSKDKLYHVHPINSKHTLRRSMVELEKHIMNVFHRLSHKFSIVGDVVTGRDIPKNRGSVSFFLKNIEDSKKQGSL
ncbi:MAG: hypothetical protein K9M11_03965 [Candidatus Pacebacteria bacterium]|nr:hypothetical protein [Candidatus Paceibacterota bacterium]